MVLPQFEYMTASTVEEACRLLLDPEHIWRALNGMEDDRNSK